MIRWIFGLPYIELYMDEEINTLLSKFLIKRSMYCHLRKKRFYFSQKAQTTSLAFKDKEEELLISKFRSKFRNEIRNFSKKRISNQVIINNSYILSIEIINFLLKNYRGQKPNIRKLNKLAKKNNISFFTILHNKNIVCSQVWITKNPRARLIYNVSDYNYMKIFKLNSANKYLMFSTIIFFNKKNFTNIDLGGLSQNNNNIDKFKLQFSKNKITSYNTIYI